MRKLAPLYSLLFVSWPFQALSSETESSIAAATEPTMFMASLRVLWGLLIVLAIIFAIYALAKKKFNFLPGNNQTSTINIIETKHLMPKKALYLIEIRGEEFLIGVSDQNINLLSKLNGNSEDFGALLKQSMSTDES